jgi:hypothetical protein
VHFTLRRRCNYHFTDFHNLHVCNHFVLGRKLNLRLSSKYICSSAPQTEAYYFFRLLRFKKHDFLSSQLSFFALEMNITAETSTPATATTNDSPPPQIKTTTTSKIALLELSEKIDLTKHVNIRPICLESIPMPAASTLASQDHVSHDSPSPSSSEGPHIFVNKYDDKKQDGQQRKRNKKEFELKKKAPQMNGKKVTGQNLMNSKPLVKDKSTNDFLECYVAGWGSQNQPSVTFLSVSFLYAISLCSF